MPSDGGTSFEESGNGAPNTEWLELLEAARERRKEGNVRSAENYYRLVLRKNPRLVEALTELCVLLLEQRRETDAEKIGKELLKHKGGKSLTWARLRSQLREEYVERSKPSISAAEPSRGLSPPSDVVEDEETTSVRDEADSGSPIESGAPFKHEQWMVSGSQQVRGSPTTSAREGYIGHPSGENSTGEQQAWFLFATALIREGKFLDAERVIQNALHDDNDNIEALVLLGEVLYQQDMHTRALDPLNRVIASDMDNVRASYLLGSCYLKMGEYEKASRWLRKVTVTEPSCIDAWVKLGVSLFKQGVYGHAQEMFQRALHIRNEDPYLITYLGMALRKQGDHAGAEIAFRKAISTDPDYAPAWDQLGFSLIAIGRVQEGQQLRNRARSIAHRTGTKLSLD